MELGYTIPLQRQAGLKSLPCPLQKDLLFCWDAHCIVLRGRLSLLLVNCHNRYSVVLFDAWSALTGGLAQSMEAWLWQSLRMSGLPRGLLESYRRQAGDAFITRTHGRREVAFLNRAWEDVLAADMAADLQNVCQPTLDHVVNALPRRCGGWEGIQTSYGRMEQDLGRCRG